MYVHEMHLVLATNRVGTLATHAHVRDAANTIDDFEGGGNNRGRRVGLSYGRCSANVPTGKLGEGRALLGALRRMKFPEVIYFISIVYIVLQIAIYMDTPAN